ncbi:MAG TPA: 50S ribosomal protein L25 [Dehalococcoidia bacterium]|nr:50S ribosomal protein L25 [Dehalococcoidia bacterium]
MTTQAVKLELQPREILGKKVKQLRREGIIPVHLYGPDMEPRFLQCEHREVLRALARSGGTTPILVSVQGERSEQLTFAREIQWHPVRGDVLHVDFLAVRVTQRVTAQVPINLVGESPGAKEAGGSAIQQLRELTIEALPLEIPSEIEVNLEELTDPNGTIRAGDLVLPPNVAMLTDPEDVVVRIEVTREEEVEEEVEEEKAAAEGEAQEGAEASTESPEQDSEDGS